MDKPDLRGYDWVIVGGESGPNHRDMPHEWVWPIKDACRDNNVAFFFKQSSAPQSETGTALRCPDGSRHEFREMPDLPQMTIRARRAHERKMVA